MNFTVTPKTMEKSTQLKAVNVSEGILELYVKFDFGKPVRPEEIRIDWRFSMRDIHAIWTPQGGSNRAVGVDWRKRRADSRQAVGAPVFACIKPDGKNALTVGVSDAKTPLAIAGGVSEENADLACYVAFFTAPVAPIDTYEAVIRLDTRDLPFTKTVLDVGTWWEKECGYPRAAVPEDTKLPMNSAWYTFHQQLELESLLKECRLSAEYGLKTIIIDDGWQTDNNERGYSYCGDWELCKKKIPDMAKLVGDIHDLGMKVILWYSVPFVGKYSKAYERFKDKALKGKDGLVLTLDVRYPEVREYLVEVYARALREWDLDGFKLDFVDCFRMYEETPDFCEGMDYSSIEDAVECLFADIIKTLGKIKAGLMFEFRQGYFGPSILKYGNMVRVGDCPYSTLQNRSEIVNLRLTSGNIPVHSDMLMWHREDTVENVAQQLISTLFGVPQISVKLGEISEEQKRALRFWMELYTQNEALLHGGEFTVKNPEISYTQVSSKSDDEAFTVRYAALPFEVEDKKKQIFVNSTYTEGTVLLNIKSSFKATVQNCMGDVVRELVLTPASVSTVNVPPCGLITLIRE